MFKWTSVLAFVVACCVGATALCAEGEKPERKRGERPTFNVEDIFKAINNGEAFTLEQYQKSRMGQRLGDRAKERFEAMDKDKNGKVTLEEFKAAWEARAKERPSGKRPGGERGKKPTT